MPKKILAALLCIIIMAGITACSFNKAPDKDNAPEQEENTVVAEDDRTINVAIYGWDTYNPITTQSQSVRDCMRFVYEPLFELDDGLLPEGVLADSRSVSSDGKSLTVKLKQGVKWHDGAAFTADDVVYTFNSIKARSDCPYNTSLEGITACRKTAADTVVFSLSQPITDAASLLSFPIVKNKTPMTVDSGYTPIGTGPYKYAGRIKQDVVYLANDTSWHKGWVNIAGICVTMTSDKEHARSLFEAGETDIATDDVIDFASYTPKGGAIIKDYITNNLTYLGVNFNKRILWGAGTRKALGAVINKSELATGVIFKRGVEIDVPINPTSFYYYDVTQRFGSKAQTAEEYLAQDGWSRDDDTGIYVRSTDGTREKLSVSILVNSDSEEKTAVAERIAEQYNAFGIEAKVDGVEYSRYKSRVQSGNFDLFIGETALPDNMDPSVLVKGGDNYFSYKNSELDTVLSEMGKTTDTETLRTLFIRYGDCIAADTPFVALYFKKAGVAYRNRIISGVSPNISNPYRNIQEWQLR